MGIFDRLGRMARAEVSELKRVLREAKHDDLPDFEREELERERLIAEAEAELARGEVDVLAAEIEGRLGGRADDIEAGAAVWGTATPDVQRDIERGAALWGGAAPDPAPAVAPVAPQASSTPPREARVGAFSREVREAYATLELPLGADREAIEASFRTLLQRYHPDRHAQAPHLQRAATELTVRIREARDLLLAWLGGA